MLKIAFIIFVVSFTNAQGKVPVSSIKPAHQAYLAAISTQERRIIAYLENNMQQLLEGDGVSVAAMAEELGIQSSISLGRKISRLKKKLSAEHFMHRLERAQLWVKADYKLVSYYRFSDIAEAISIQERQVVAYFENNMQLLLEGKGVHIAAMAEALGFANGNSLGWTIHTLKKALPEEHFIHRLVHKQRSVAGKTVSYYRFVDAISQQGRQVIAYLEDNMQFLEGDGVSIAAMAEALGFTSSISLGQIIRALKKKLPNEHFIHKLAYKQRRVDDKIVTYYVSANTIRHEKKQVVAYFEDNMQLLEGDGLSIAATAEELGLRNSYSLGRIISALKKELPEEHFIHKLEPRGQTVDGKTVTYYHFAEAIIHKKEKTIAYLEDNMQILEENGLSTAAIAEDLGLKNGYSLGRIILTLKKELPEEHFIHRLVRKQRSVAGKYSNYYIIAIP